MLLNGGGMMDNDLIKILLSGEIDVEGTVSKINQQTKEISDKVNPVKVKSTSSDVKGVKREYSEIAKHLDTITAKTDKFYDSTGRISKVVKTSNDAFGRQLRVVKQLDAETGKLHVTQEKVSHNIKSMADSLSKFQANQLRKLDGVGGGSSEVAKLKKEVQELSVSTENLEKKKIALADAITRTISAEKESLRVQRDSERNQSKQLWGMSKDLLSTKTPDGLKQLNNWYKELETVSNKINSFQANYNQKLAELSRNFGETEGIRKFGEELNKLSVDTPDVINKMDKMKIQFRDVREEARGGAAGIGEISQSLGSMAKQALSFAGIHLSIYGMFSAIRNGIGTINDMNASLTEIGMVTNQHVSDIGHLAFEYNNLAKEMKVSTNEVMDGVVSFTRQGLEQEEVMERLSATTMFSKITNLDFAQSVEYLTATVNSMGMDVEKATDVFIYLGDATATSGAEVAEGFNAVSGVANAMGLEFEKVASWIASISAKTRESAGSIGRSVNMIISRMARLTEEGFDEEDGTKVNDVAKALDSVGVKLMDEQNNFRNFADVIDDVAVKWDTLTEKEKIYVGNAIAGARHQSRFFNLMESYTESLELYEGALDASGTTQEKFGIYAESTQAKIDELKSTIEGLWLTLLDSGVIDSVIQAVTRLIESMTTLVDKFGGLGIVVPAFIGLLAKAKVQTVLFGEEAKGLGVALLKLFSKTKDSSDDLLDASKSTETAISSIVKTVTSSISAMTSAITAGKLAMGGLIAVMGAAVIASIRYANAQDRAKEAMLEGANTTRELVAEMDKLDDLAEKQRRLTNIEEKSEEQKRELLQVQRELADTYPTLATGLDEEGRAIADNIDLTTRLVEEKRELLLAQLDANKSLADSTLPQMREELAKTMYSIQMQQEALNNPDEQSVNLDEVAKALQGNIEEYSKLSKEIEWAEQVRSEYIEQAVLQADAEKWLQAEMLVTQIQTASSADEARHYEEQLLSLGFNSVQVSEMMAGGLQSVKEGTDIASDANYNYIMALETMDAKEAESTANVLRQQQARTASVISESRKRIQAMQAELQAMVAVYGVKASSMNFLQSGAVGPLSWDVAKIEYESPGDFAQIQQYRAATSALARAEQEQKKINEMLNKVNSITPGGGGVGGGGGGKSGGGKGKTKKKPAKRKSAKKKREYEAKQSEITELEKSIKDLEFTINRYDKLIANTKSSDRRNKAIKETIKLNKQHQKELHKLNELMRKERASIGKSLQGQGIGTFDESTGRLLVNLEKYNKLSDENKEKVDKQISELDKLTDSINSNSLKWHDLKKAIQDTNMELIKLHTEEVEDALKYLEFDLENVRLAMNKLEETSEDYWKMQKDELEMLAEKRVVLEELLQARIKDYQTQELSIDQYEELKDQILGLREAIRGVNEEMYSIGDNNKKYLSNVADDVVDAYKKAYELKKKTALDALEEEMKLEEKRHKAAMENYDDELKAIEKLVKAKLDDLDERVDREKYEQQLQKEQAERQRILNEINKFGMDDSVEGRQRVAKLNEELEKQNEKIATMKYDRDIKLRKKNLQDQLNKTKEEIKDNKDKEDEKLRQLKERMDEEKERIEEHYDDILNNERYFAEIRENIMKGHFDQVYEDFSGFVDSFAKDSIYLGEVITQNITDRLKEVTGVLTVLDSMKIDKDGNATVRIRNDYSKMSGKSTQQQKELINHIVWLKGKWEDANKRGDEEGKKWAAQKAQGYYKDLDEDYAVLLNQMNHEAAYDWYKSGKWEKVKPAPKASRGNNAAHDARMYDRWLKDSVVENKQKGDDYSSFAGDISRAIDYKRMWHEYDDRYKRTGSQSDKQLRDSASQQANNVYRKMPPKLARKLQSMNYDEALKWYESGKYRNVFHTGGIVGGKANKMTELFNKLANNSIGSNEQVIKAVKGELLIPQENIQKNLVPNLQKMLGSSDGGNIYIESLIDIKDFNNESNADIETIVQASVDKLFHTAGKRGYKMNRRL